MNPELHMQYTGASNELILNNLTALARTGAEIVIRIPLISGINADAANMAASAGFIASLEGPRKKVSLPGYQAITWNGLLAPGATSREICEKLAAEIARLL